MKKMKRVFKKSYIVFKREVIETKCMINVIKKRDKKNYIYAKEQFKDIMKFSVLIPIITLPGSVFIISAIEIIGKKFKFSIFPKKQKFIKNRGEKTLP